MPDGLVLKLVEVGRLLLGVALGEAARGRREPLLIELGLHLEVGLLVRVGQRRRKRRLLGQRIRRARF
jgi:hypothetical protein